MVGGLNMGVVAQAQAIKELLVAMNVFDHVWLGSPDKIPMGDRLVAIVEPVTAPTFYYTMCATSTTKDVDFYITILSKGKVEQAHIYSWEQTDAVLAMIYANNKIKGTASDVTVEEVTYGEMAAPEGKQLIAASRITLRCRA